VKEQNFSLMLHHFYLTVCVPSFNLYSLPDGPLKSVKLSFYCIDSC
jgi:hypothetical protein